jgi:hypothetical protein
MPQFASVVLKDSADANHSFVPRDIVGGVATLVSSTGVPLADKTISISNTRTSTGRRKVQLKLAIPVIQDVVVGGISKPTAVRTAYADVVFTFDGSSTTVERADLLAYLYNALEEDDVFGPAIVDLSSLY